MMRSRKIRIALLFASLVFAAFGAAAPASASCIDSPIDGRCMNICPQGLQKFGFECLA